MKTHSMHTHFLLLSSFMLLLLAPSLARAWSYAGHQAVAHLAEEYLTDLTKKKIHNILPLGENLVTVATWADEIRPLRPEVSPWHYIDLPVRDAITITNLASYCGTNDILFQINVCIEKLKNPQTAPSNQVEYLKFLVHFAGDICMPFHCSNDEDRGGNEKIVHFYGPSGCRPIGNTMKLHALWDHLIRREPGDDPVKLAASLQSEITMKQISAWTKGGPREWALDTYAVAKQVVYDGLPPGPTPKGESIDLPRRYFSMMRPTARMQLSKAGIRLAAVLNGIYDAGTEAR